MFHFDMITGETLTSQDWRPLVRLVTEPTDRRHQVARIRYVDATNRTTTFTDPIVNHARHSALELPAGELHTTDVFVFADGRILFVDDDGFTAWRRTGGTEKRRQAPPFEPHLPIPAKPLRVE